MAKDVILPGMVGIPEIKCSVLGDWSVSFYEEFEGLLFSSERINSGIGQMIDFCESQKYTQGFRREIVISGLPFLCAIRPEEKKLYIGTRRLSRELSLLKLDSSALASNNPAMESAFVRLKDHVEKIMALSTGQFPSELEWVTHLNGLPAFWKKEDWKEVDHEAQNILHQLVKKVSEYRPSPIEKLSDYGLTLTAQYDLIRVHLLKFLALLPSLDHDKVGGEVKRNLLESLRRLKSDSQQLTLNKNKASRPLPTFLFWAFLFSSFLANIIPARILALIVRSLVRTMARRFIAGESIATSDKTLSELRRSGREATLDQLGELVVSAKEADEYFEKVLLLIHGLKQHIPKGEKNAAGILKAHVSIKVSALGHDIRAEAFDTTYAKVAPRLKRILKEAQREEVFINIDAEHYHYRDVVFQIFSKVLLETEELRHFSQTGIVVQAYLRDGAKHLRDVVKLAQKRNLPMPIRLVKGAYWDAETIEAEAHQFEARQFLNKEESDLHFRQLAYLSLENFQWIHLAIGSHNLQDHAFVEALRQLKFPKARVIEHQCLHMTYEALSHGLKEMGWPTRNYMPIGNLLVGMAYLVRRIMENSSQVGVLSIMRSHQKSAGLVSPVEVHLQKKQNSQLHFDSLATQLKGDYHPVRPLRLYLENERMILEEEIQKLRTYFQSHQGQWNSQTAKKIFSSSEPTLCLGVVEENTTQEAVSSVESALVGLKASYWADQSQALYRVSVMLKAADLMLISRHHLAALMMFEAAKTMSEALADVDEAIDFINFYARQEIQLQLSGEKLTNRGVIGVIAPWNFPLAIPCGMTVAALVAGNAVILKPAEQTPLIGEKLYQLLLLAGVPKEIFYLIQGDGERVGAPIVQHPEVAGIVFTGSKSVGQWIYREAASKIVHHYQHQFPMQKKIITEMGGKNAIIVTNNCEMDETISGILYSAFGHAGQKCSAASRIIVHKEVKNALVKRLREATSDIKVGSSLDPSTSVNPLISEFDQLRVRKIVEEAKDEAIRSQGEIIIDRSFEKLPGLNVGPVILEIPIHQARKKESWSQREIFGPVIHIVEYQSLIEAIELFNSTEYALTGGIFSQSQDDIDFLLRFLRAGNLYVNRPNTGARVGIEPFGGFKLSGTGPKAGGYDYLGEFHYPLISQASQPLSTQWAPSSGYQLPIPRPSLIGLGARLSRFHHFSEDFINQYELIMGHVDEREKAQLNDFIHWINEHLISYLSGKHLNHSIPGQLSYNDKSLIKEAGVFVMVSSIPSLKAIFYFMGAMSVGSGVSVVCTTQEAYGTWKIILDLAWKAGLSKANMDLTLATGKELVSILEAPEYSYVYGDLYPEYNEELYQHIFAGHSLQQYMRILLSPIDGHSLKNPTQILDQFVWIRSFAINTMRHGAPLEILE